MYMIKVLVELYRTLLRNGKDLTQINYGIFLVKITLHRLKENWNQK